MPGTAGTGRGPDVVVEGVVDSCRTVGWGVVEVMVVVVAAATVVSWGGDEVGSWGADVPEVEGTTETMGKGTEVEEIFGGEVEGGDAVEGTGAEAAGGANVWGADITTGRGAEVAGGTVGRGADVTAGSPSG